MGLGDNLRALLSGKKRLLRQGRGAYARLMFYKREAWRFMVFLHDYSQKGPKEAFIAFGIVASGMIMLIGAGWCAMSCCSILLSEDDEYPPLPPSSQARNLKRD